MTLKNKEYCDGCPELKELGTLGQHFKCMKYGIVMLERNDVFLGAKGQFKFIRLDKCKEDNK